MNWRRGKTLWTTPILKSGLWHGLFMSVQAANFGGLWALIASLNRRVARRSLVRFRQGSGCLFAFRAVRGRSHKQISLPIALSWFSGVGHRTSLWTAPRPRRAPPASGIVWPLALRLRRMKGLLRFSDSSLISMPGESALHCLLKRSQMRFLLLFTPPTATAWFPIDR